MCFQEGGIIATEEDPNVSYDYLASAANFMFLQDLNANERGMRLERAGGNGHWELKMAGNLFHIQRVYQPPCCGF